MTPIYTQTIIERTPLGQVPIDPLREYLEQSECCRELVPAHELDAATGYCWGCSDD